MKDSAVSCPAEITYGLSGIHVARQVRTGAQVAETLLEVEPRPPMPDDAFAAWWSAYIRGPRAQVHRNAPPVRFIDLFSSVGGLSLGALEAMASLGLRGTSLLAADVDRRALQVYRSNLKPRFATSESVRGMLDFRVVGTGDRANFAFDPEITADMLASHIGRVDMVLAGPPCQGHSSLNNHSRHEDPKNLLYLTVPAAAVALGATHVIIENVPNVVADRHGVVQTTISLLKNAGYRLSSGVLAANDLGWPQTRKRFFLVASRAGQPADLREMAAAMKRAALPVSWLLDDLAQEPLDDGDVMRSVPRSSAENEMRIGWLYENDAYDLPNAIRPDCHKDGTTYPATYGRMRWDAAAPTITGGFLTPGRGRFIHPTKPRVLTPREAARIQGFPDWFSFTASPAEPPTRAEVSRWIGNAVPSILGMTATLSALATTRTIHEDPAYATTEHAT